MKLPKFNQSGIAHILAPLLFIVLFAAVGGYVLLKSHAAPVSTGSTASPYGTLKKIEQIAKQTNNKYAWWSLKNYLTDHMISGSEDALHLPLDGDMTKLEAACLHNFVCKLGVKGTALNGQFTSMNWVASDGSSKGVTIYYKLKNINKSASLSLGNQSVRIVMVSNAKGNRWKVDQIYIGNKYQVPSGTFDYSYYGCGSSTGCTYHPKY